MIDDSGFFARRCLGLVSRLFGGDWAGFRPNGEDGCAWTARRGFGAATAGDDFLESEAILTRRRVLRLAGLCGIELGGFGSNGRSHKRSQFAFTIMIQKGLYADKKRGSVLLPEDDEGGPGLTWRRARPTEMFLWRTSCFRFVGAAGS